MQSMVLDSYALMAFLEDEPCADIVRNLILRSQQTDLKLIMNVVNLGEIWYSYARLTSEHRADQIIEQIKGLPVEIIDVDWYLTHQAAAFKAKGHISYADCFAAALAKLHKADLVTGDKEFEKLQDKISILWL